MSMTIKSEAAHKLARQLSRLAGESITKTVTESLRERLCRIQNKQSATLSARLLEIGRDCAPRLKKPSRSADHGDLLYEEKVCQNKQAKMSPEARAGFGKGTRSTRAVELIDDSRFSA